MDNSNYLHSEISWLRGAVKKAEEEAAGYKKILEDILQADQRGIDAWRAATGNAKDVMPKDRSHLILWLLSENERLKTELARSKALEEELPPMGGIHS
jgi:hypothetical protein